MNKQDIKNFTLQELTEDIVDMGESAYRTKQLFNWLYKKGISDFSQMSNLPKSFIEKLSAKYYIGKLELSNHLKSRERVEKFLFRLSDGNYIETVLICSKERKTICISSQVGCKFACAFCASGKIGFIRDLTTSEIISQILFLQHELKHGITNYVFMGMGEPLDNYDNVTRAVMIMNDPQAMEIGARRITLSTCGIIPGIRRLKDLGIQINLSISLHAADNRLRDRLMPVNKRYPLKKLIASCEDFIRDANRMITFEYILIKGVNDYEDDAEKLADMAIKLNTKINLIPYSIVDGAGFKAPSDILLDAFASKLSAAGAKITIRESKGKDIQSACGQLAGRKD